MAGVFYFYACKMDSTFLSYTDQIGRTVAPIRQGEYLHVHNVKTKRW